MSYCYATFDDIPEHIRYYVGEQDVCSMPYHIMAAGINAQGRNYFTDRCGHDMLFICLTLSGQGSVICGDECNLLLPGDLLILDCKQPHYYRSESDCWKFLWIQTKGHGTRGLFPVLAPKGIWYRHMRDTAFIHDLYRRLIPLIDQPTPAGNIDASELMEGFMYQLARISMTEDDSRMPSAIHQALDYIRDHLYEDISVEAMAATLNYSVYYFSRLFHKHIGISPYRYILGLRLHKAAALLLTTELSIAEIARAANFSDASRFATHFQRQYGTTPLRYRKSRKNSLQA